MANSGSNIKSNDRYTDRLQALRRAKSRKMLLENLEARQLLTGGPDLIGVQPNEGSLLRDGTVLNVSPRELVFRFDDESALDASTLDAIQITRTGGDGVFERAFVSTDLNSNGAVVLDFAAAEGTRGDGVEVEFTTSSRVGSREPIVTVQGQRVQVEVNTNPSFATRAQDLLDTLRGNAAASQLIFPSILRGNPLFPIANSVGNGSVFVLEGSNAARASTDFNLGGELQVEFLSRLPGAAGRDIEINFTSSDFGGAGGPTVTVINQQINVVLNSDARFATSAQQVVDAINSDSLASQLVQARFISGSPAARVGLADIDFSPLTLEGGSDVSVVPAFVGLGDTNREVVFRFAETLPDDTYRIDILGEGALALQNLAGEAFNDGQSTSIEFELDLGARIEAVVPQPVTRQPDGSLQQERNVIYVYFNDDDLDPATAEDPQFYQLRHTNDSLTTGDDVVITPSNVEYSADSDLAILTFSRNLDQLVDGAGNALPLSVLRLRVGSNEAPAPLPNTLDQIVDPGDRFATAVDISSNFASGTTAAVTVSSEIRNTTPFVLDFPGANDEPGIRSNRFQQHVTTVDTDGIEVLEYNFQSLLGNIGGSIQQNAITEAQQDLVRQVLTLYEEYLGVRFIETATTGFTVAVGDMRVVGGQLNAPGGERLAAGLLASGQPAVVLDIQDFDASTQVEFGNELFQGFTQGIGFLLGLGRAEELPPGTIQRDAPIVGRGVETELQFPSPADIVSGRFVLRPEGQDVDLYRFNLPTAGQISIEVFAQRLANTSLLDSALRLYQLGSDGEYVEIAANDDYFSQDSRLRLDLEAGEYVLGVSAKGNEDYDPNIANSGLGGLSEGNYDVRIDFRPPADSFILDTDVDGGQVPIDGDSNGRPGGTFDFFFVPNAPDQTLFVDKASGPGGDGSIQSPFYRISDALDAVAAGQVIRIVGNGGADGLLETQDDNLAYEIGFNRLNQVQADGATFEVPTDVTVMIDHGAILKLSRARIGVGSTSVSVDRSGGALQVLGVPRLLDTNGNVVFDNSSDPVPGSVYFTSLNDTIGVGSNQDINPPAPQPGDWGGIDFRNDIDGNDETRRDLEDDGLFVNSLIHGDIRFGGGQVIVDGVSQVITPVHLVDSRPTIGNNIIEFSADAAISATQNSFEESTFTDPASQAADPFIPDFERVGPSIFGNRTVNNSINGLFIDVQTTAGNATEELTVPGRFDDTDIVHVLTENLTIAGSVGGPIEDTAAPPTSIVTLTEIAGVGQLAAGEYRYQLVYVDAQGNESPASAPTAAVTVGDNGSIRLENLPPIGDLPFSTRRLYRSEVGGNGPFRLAATLNAIQTTFVDSGAFTGGVLVENTSALRARPAAGLVIDPGSIVKLQGSRIEVGIGGSLIAEGVDGLPVVFTSVNDNTFGTGGTFDTTNNAASRPALQGDFGGIYAAPASTLSIDYSRFSFGGGTTRIDGGFASFNVIEIHQAEARIANSEFQSNADGTEGANPTTRAGRGTNFESTIFVRGAQPILVNNILTDNEAAAISIDVNSINSDFVDDYGRSTGRLDRAGDFIANQGPLIRGNRLDRNAINGLVVRGQTVSTQSIWDDTDIVHVVQDQIEITNHTTFGGVRLVSRGTESLVVKLGEGDNPGFTVDGVPLDIDDRIGGSLQAIGNAAAPVVLTSIHDCFVGAGFTPTGEPQLDTLNSGACGVADVEVPFADVIVVVDESASMAFAQDFSVELIQDLDQAFIAAGIGAAGAGGNRFGLVGFGNFDIDPRAIPLGPNGELFGTSQQYVDAAVNLEESGAIEDGFFAIDFALDNYEFRQPAAKFVLLITNEDRDVVADQFTFDTTLQALNEQGVVLDTIIEVDIVDGNGTEAVGLDSQNLAYLADGLGGFSTSPNGIITGAFGTTEEDYANLSFSTGGVIGDINQIQEGGLTATSFSNALTTTIVAQAGGTIAQPGDHDSISFQTYSNDRNVLALTELEPTTGANINVNNTPGNAQFLGALAPDLLSGDENRRLGFEIQGVLNERTDLDTYSFTASGGTEVFLDIDRTQNSLDTVVELIDADGNILALSDSSFAEENDPTLLQSSPVLGNNSVAPLRRSPLGLAPQDSRGQSRDLFSTNTQDAGFRVVLPGLSTQETLYHIRVRSSSLSPGDNPSDLLDPASLNAGLSRGGYQLQVRLSEIDEVPGSSIDFADIRFASTGISLEGVPRQSPLAGETSEVSEAAGPQNNTIATAQPLGNILATDRQAISISGRLDSPDDVDFFSFEIDYEFLVTPLLEYFSTIFDIDYADGIGRPDTSLYLFDGNGALISSGLDSNILDDRLADLSGTVGADLSGGSTGTLDAFLGAVELPPGQYFIAVTNSSQIPAALSGLTQSGSNDGLVRLQPASNTQFIVEDHVGFEGGSTAVGPVVTNFIDNNSVVPFTLADVPLYVTADRGTDLTDILIVNPFSGEQSNNVGRIPNDIRDLEFRPNGVLQGFDTAAEDFPVGADRDTLTDFLTIDFADATVTNVGQFNAQTFGRDAMGDVVDANVGVIIEAVTFAQVNGEEIGFAVGNRGGGFLADGYQTNILYRFDPETGVAESFPGLDRVDNSGNGGFDERIFGAGSDIVERGQITTEGVPGQQSQRLVVSEATLTSSFGQSTTQIFDGASFTLIDNSGFVVDFEFNSGPEATFNFDPLVGIAPQDGDQIFIDGIVYEFDSEAVTNVTASAVAVPLPLNPTAEQFLSALQDVLPSEIVIGREGTRVNFSGATTVDFGDLQGRGVFTNPRSDSDVGGGNIPISFLAQDTADTIAARVAQAINNSGIPGLGASSNGRDVNIVNASIVGTPSQPLIAADLAPGGIVTGIAAVGTTLYAVSDAGGLYEIPNPSAFSPTFGFEFNQSYVTTSTDLLGLNFTGLTAGPRNLQNGQFADLLFATTADGRIHAFDTDGVLQPVFAGGATSIDTNIVGLTGLSFTNLDFNLFHQTGQRGNDPGHGLPALPDGSRAAVAGGQSYFFGFENRFAHPNASFTDLEVPGFTDSLNFAGGALGVLQSNPFSLSGIQAADSPFLYFNYFLDTEDSNSDLNDNEVFLDSFRVYASLESGEEVLLTTNNSERGGGPSDDEFDFSISDHPATQETFDGQGFRQARVNLAPLVGQENIRLRFEFSTAGGLGIGAVGGQSERLRILGADRLADGMQLIVNGQVFEIDLGITTVVPTGQQIENGDGLNIDGTTYAFFNGIGAPPAADVLVNFSGNETADQIAQILASAIQNSTPNQPVTNGLDFSPETPVPNDIIPRATQTLVLGQNGIFNGSGTIGDQSTDPAVADQDVDLIEVTLNEGTEVDVSVFASSVGSSLVPTLRVFDAEGNELNSIRSSLGGSDQLLSFTAPETGQYFIGVSAIGNSSYNPSIAGTATPGGSSGDYDLSINVQRLLEPVVVGSIVQLIGALSVIPTAGSDFGLNGDFGSDGFAIPIRIDDDVSEVTDAVARAFGDAFSGGNENAFANDGFSIEIEGLNIASSGPFGIIGARAENQFSEFAIANPNNRPALRAQNNNIEGLYLDDFIIGTVERGEVILDSNGSGSTFIPNPEDPLGIVIGEYQLEIRGGSDFGVPTPGNIILTDAFSPTERLVSGQNLRLNSAAAIPDGSIFTISDGLAEITFEFENTQSANGVTPGHVAVPISSLIVDPFTGLQRIMTANDVAAVVRDVINSPIVQSQLSISAIAINGDQTGATADTLAIIGNATITIPNAIGTVEILEGIGDENRRREQGQVVVRNTRISDSSGFGISVRSDERNESGAPNPGTVRNTIVTNTERLLPGAVIENNILAGNSAGGIQVIGGSSADGEVAAPVPFARIVNNTILGGNVTQPVPVSSLTVGTTFFPAGNQSFADEVIEFNAGFSGGGQPVAGLQDPEQALGAPDFEGLGEPEIVDGVVDEGVVSLGSGGRLTVEFIDNFLLPSGDASPDLFIEEVGIAERFSVEISVDGVSFINLGSFDGGTTLIDIDPFVENEFQRIYFVRLTDDQFEGPATGVAVGADIDSIGAINSVPNEVYSAGGVGISVTQSASPTLLNNVIINSDTGILVDGSSQTTVIGGSLFQQNTSNVSGVDLDQFAIEAENNLALFVNPAQRNLYPSNSSPIIDSSIASLSDRAPLAAVRQSLGLGLSPIIAPSLDANGTLRVDDPTVDTPNGLGGNVFIDRGAVDRSDTLGPTSFLINPLDNDTLGVDTNGDESLVELINTSLEFFDIRLIDGAGENGFSQGSGIDDSSITSEAVLLFQNDVPLVEGVDYNFNYHPTSNTIRLTPLSGVWPQDSVYRLEFLGSTEASIQAIDARDYSDGSSITIFDANGVPTVFEIELGILLTVPSAISETQNVSVNDLNDGDRFTIDDGNQVLEFEIDTDGDSDPAAITVAISEDDTAAEVAEVIETAIAGSGLQVVASALLDGRVQILGSPILSVTTAVENLRITGNSGVRPAFGLQIPLVGGQPEALNDGETFTIALGNGESATFEFDTDGSVLDGSIAVQLPLGADVDAIADAIAAAIDGAGLGLSSSNNGNGFIGVGGTRIAAIDASSTLLNVVGTPDLSAAIPIQFNLDLNQSADETASAIAATINAQNLAGVTITQFGSRLFIEGARGASGSGAGLVQPIRDLAGNPITPNRNDGSTELEIFIGQGFDFGDAPDSPHATRLENNGPRHSVVEGFSLGATVTPDADARLDDGDLDDGVTFSDAIYAAFGTSITVNATGIQAGRRGFLTAWIDVDGDGEFEDTERIVNGRLLDNGENVLPDFRIVSTADVGEVFARFRFSSTPISSPVGEAVDGEVEDHVITILANPYQNQSINLDVTGEGNISPLDVLRVISFINRNGSQNLTVPVDQNIIDTFGQIDVNGDGRISPIDALTIISFINQRSAGEGEGEGEASFDYDDQSFSSSQFISASSARTIAGGLSQDQSSGGTGPIRSNRVTDSVAGFATSGVTADLSSNSVAVFEDPANQAIEDVLTDIAADRDEDSENVFDSLFNNDFWR